MNRVELKNMAKSQIKGNIGMLLVITLLAGLLQCIPYVSYVIAPAISLGLVIVYLNLTYGKKPEINALFDGFRSFGKALWLYILVGFFTALWSMLFVIPGIIKGLSYSMAYYVLADHPEMTARQALNESKRIMEGHKMELFVLELSFTGWLLLTGVTFGIAAIYVVPYMSATIANFYNSIKNNTTTYAVY